jgi:hypothetical protein
MKRTVYRGDRAPIGDGKMGWHYRLIGTFEGDDEAAILDRAAQEPLERGGPPGFKSFAEMCAARGHTARNYRMKDPALDPTLPFDEDL